MTAEQSQPLTPYASRGGEIEGSFGFQPCGTSPSDYVVPEVEPSAAHTPGPWRVQGGTALVWGGCDEDDHTSRGMGVPVAEARLTAPHWYRQTGGASDLPAEANARLIAAAPELLASLAALVEQNVCYDGDSIVIKCADHAEALRVVRQARAALAKSRAE